jgi:uncharacterized protein (TIGR00299 family) protein
VLAYFDCFSGISGDMALGAFIDLGVPVDHLQKAFSRLPIEPLEVKVTPVERHGIRAVRCEIVTAESNTARNFADLRQLIADSDLKASIKASALSIFHKLAVAESGIHGCAIDAVHFHEVGAVDAIADIVGSCLCLEYLGITRVVASAMPQGHGFVNCRHGRLPLPAPATLALLKDIPVYGIDLEGELVTPTGAAIAATLGEGFGPMPPMAITSIGYGAGYREFPNHPNLLRIVVGKPLADRHLADRHKDELRYLTDSVHIIETAIDDMNPEIFGYLMEELFANGALDVCWIPVYMKKNRPGTQLQILCHADWFESLRDVLFRETTSIGLRVSTASRWMLPRETVTLTLSMGRVALKRVVQPNGETRWVPEYEDCRRIARTQGIPLRRAYEQIAREAAELPPDMIPATTDR